MRKSMKGKRTPKTSSILVYRAKGMSINDIARILGCTKQWVDFVLKRDGDTLPIELAVKSYPQVDIEHPIDKVVSNDKIQLDNIIK